MSDHLLLPPLRRRALRAGMALAWLAGAACLPAQAQDGLPKRKPGLWSMQMQMPGMPAGMGPSQQCVDAASDEAMQRQALSGPGKSNCKQIALKRAGGVTTYEAECTNAEGKVHMVARISGDMQTSYRMDNHATFTPPRHGMREMDMVVQATHQGACPAGMQPGEVRMAGMSMPPGGRPNMSPEQMKQMGEQLKRMQQQQKAP